MTEIDELKVIKSKEETKKQSVADLNRELEEKVYKMIIDYIKKK